MSSNVTKRDSRTNIDSSPGWERRMLLGSGCRRNGKSFVSGIKQEFREHPLLIDATHRHGDVVEGDFCSLRHGQVIPLAVGEAFAGVANGFGTTSDGNYFVSVVCRGALSTKVEGLTLATPERTPVFCLPGKNTQPLTLDDSGILVGQVICAESAERAIVGFRLAGDARPFELMSAPRPR